MTSDFYKRKSLLANARKAISEDEWYEYLEKNYPDWWKSVYHNKWRINIIYYDTNGSTVYPMYINKNYTMEEIMIHFYKILMSQRLAIYMCFGKDISGNIVKFLPEIDFYNQHKTYKTLNNYIYVHKRIFNIDNTIDFKRIRVSNDKKLIHLCGDLCQQDTTNLNLRIRKDTKVLSNKHNFEKIFSY
jgi:hypothetical protein